MSVTIEDLTILDKALMYSGTLFWTKARNFRFPGAFLGTLPFPMTTVLAVGMIFDIDVADEGTGGVCSADGCKY